MFPNSLKLADVTTLQRLTKETYRPVSITLSTSSNFFERIRFTKISALTLQFENAKTEKCFDNGKVSDVLLTDLSKAFDCLEHELLTAKSNAYSFNPPALRLIHDYLSNTNLRI